jgi:hypothetical protein
MGTGLFFRMIKNILTLDRCWWLTPEILATQEAAISRIMLQNQPQANSSRDPSSKKPITKKKKRLA